MTPFQSPDPLVDLAQAGFPETQIAAWRRQREATQLFQEVETAIDAVMKRFPPVKRPGNSVAGAAAAKIMRRAVRGLEVIA